MQRLIKFRGWHEQLKKMFSAEEMGADQLTIMTDGRGFVNVSGESTSRSEFPKMIPLQYTGLKDTNGVEIYEGDILSNKDYISDAHCSFNLGNTAVEWNNECGCWIGIVGEVFEVIGNIYESPGLLEGK